MKEENLKYMGISKYFPKKLIDISTTNCGHKATNTIDNEDQKMTYHKHDNGIIVVNTFKVKPRPHYCSAECRIS